MTTTNTAIYYDLSLEGSPCDGNVVTAGTTQTTAYPIKAPINRVVTSATSNTSGLVLPSINNGEANSGFYVVINDTANTILVFAENGESLNGTLNASLAITTGISAIFFPVFNAHGGTVDWRRATIS